MMYYESKVYAPILAGGKAYQFYFLQEVKSFSHSLFWSTCRVSTRRDFGAGLVELGCEGTIANAPPESTNILRALQASDALSPTALSAISVSQLNE